jgi:hypothetical protein
MIIGMCSMMILATAIMVVVTTLGIGARRGV